MPKPFARKPNGWATPVAPMHQDKVRDWRAEFEQLHLPKPDAASLLYTVDPPQQLLPPPHPPFSPFPPAERRHLSFSSSTGSSLTSSSSSSALSSSHSIASIEDVFGSTVLISIDGRVVTQPALYELPCVPQDPRMKIQTLLHDSPAQLPTGPVRMDALLPIANPSPIPARTTIEEFELAVVAARAGIHLDHALCMQLEGLLRRCCDETFGVIAGHALRL